MLVIEHAWNFLEQSRTSGRDISHALLQYICNIPNSYLSCGSPREKKWITE